LVVVQLAIARRRASFLGYGCACPKVSPRTDPLGACRHVLLFDGGTETPATARRRGFYWCLRGPHLGR